MQDQDTNNEFESHWTRSCQGETKYKEIKLTMQKFHQQIGVRVQMADFKKAYPRLVHLPKQCCVGRAGLSLEGAWVRVWRGRVGPGRMRSLVGGGEG